MVIHTTSVMCTLWRGPTYGRRCHDVLLFSHMQGSQILSHGLGHGRGLKDDKGHGRGHEDGRVLDDKGSNAYQGRFTLGND